MVMNLTKILRTVSLAAFFIIPIIPFVVSSSLFFPFITGKNILFRVLVEIGVGAWAILALYDRKYRPKLSWVLVAGGLFTFFLAISDFLSVYPYKSIWSNFERMEGLVTLVHLFVYLLAITSLFKTENLWHRFLQTNIGMSVVVALYGLAQIAGTVRINQSGDRLDATLGNADYLAVYMLFNIFFSLFLLFRKSSSKAVMWVYGIIAILDAVILYYTATRGVILGLIGGIGLTALLIALFEKERPTLRKISIGAIAAIILVIGLFIAFKHTSFVQESKVLRRFASITFDVNQNNARFMIWDMAWQGFKEKPVLGWGQESFNQVFNKYYDPGLYGQEQWFDRTHNVFLDWLIAGGALGLISYLLLFITGLYYIWVIQPKASLLKKLILKFVHNPRESFTVTEKSILTGLLAGYFFHNLFVFDNIVSYFLFFTVIGYVSGSWRHFKDEAVEKSEEPSAIAQVGALAVVVVVVFGLYFTAYKPYAAAQALIQAITPQQTLGIEGNYDFFRKALDLNTVGRPEVREQILQITSQVAGASNLPAEIQQKFLTLAEEEFKKQFEESPNDARYYLFFGTFLTNLGQPNEAITYLEKARELSPRKQTILFALGSAYIDAQEYAKGFEVLKEAYEYETSNGEAKEYYAAAALYVGKPEIVKELYGNDTPGITRIARAYADLKKFDKAITTVKKVIEANPNDASSHLLLASFYIDTHNNAAAIAEIRKAIELNPDFTAQGEAIIKQLQGN
jgi:tetratricopeptide (TPR) repeat protein/O-antigen ligase